MPSRRTPRTGDKPRAVPKAAEEPSEPIGAVPTAPPGVTTSETAYVPEIVPQRPETPPVVEPAPAPPPTNPQDGHQGQVGYTEETTCPNCGKTVRLYVKKGMLRCPKCPLRSDATGLNLALTWEDQ